MDEDETRLRERDLWHLQELYELKEAYAPWTQLLHHRGLPKPACEPGLALLAYFQAQVSRACGPKMKQFGIENAKNCVCWLHMKMSRTIPSPALLRMAYVSTVVAKIGRSHATSLWSNWWEDDQNVPAVVKAYLLEICFLKNIVELLCTENDELIMLPSEPNTTDAVIDKSKLCDHVDKEVPNVILSCQNLYENLHQLYEDPAQRTYDCMWWLTVPIQLSHILKAEKLLSRRYVEQHATTLHQGLSYKHCVAQDMYEQLDDIFTHHKKSKALLAKLDFELIGTIVGSVVRECEQLTPEDFPVKLEEEWKLYNVHGWLHGSSTRTSS